MVINALNDENKMSLEKMNEDNALAVRVKPHEDELQTKRQFGKSYRAGARDDNALAVRVKPHEDELQTKRKFGRSYRAGAREVRAPFTTIWN